MHALTANLRFINDGHGIHCDGFEEQQLPVSGERRASSTVNPKAQALPLSLPPSTLEPHNLGVCRSELRFSTVSFSTPAWAGNPANRPLCHPKMGREVAGKGNRRDDSEKEGERDR